MFSKITSISINPSGLIHDSFGNKEWLKNGKRHREDGPAIEWSANGEKQWWINGRLHRDGNLPAVEYAIGRKFYYLNDRYHRENGPAIEYQNGYKEYYLNDRKFSEEDYWEEIKRRKSLNCILSNVKKYFSHPAVRNTLIDVRRGIK